MLRVAIDEQGLLQQEAPGTTATVSIEFPGDTPACLLADRAALFSAATIAGSADLAETLGLAFGNLRWDVEEDLSHLVGDVVARRSLQLAGRIAGAGLEGASKLAFAVAEYLTAEAAEIAGRKEIEGFCDQVDRSVTTSRAWKSGWHVWKRAARRLEQKRAASL